MIAPPNRSLGSRSQRSRRGFGSGKSRSTPTAPPTGSDFHYKTVDAGVDVQQLQQRRRAVVGSRVPVSSPGHLGAMWCLFRPMNSAQI
ncbi:hypothetical protein GQ600_19201 [Phytophthora cactorum]|nr:hypothetical protein GQ600_19201 [Phytophthora cactorum]